MKLAVRIFGIVGDKFAGSIKRLRKITLTGYSPAISSAKEEIDGEVQDTGNTNQVLLVKQSGRPQRDTRRKMLFCNLTLCVPCIILQCVNDQRDAQFL